MNDLDAYFDFLTRELGDPDSLLANPLPVDLEGQIEPFVGE